MKLYYFPLLSLFLLATNITSAQNHDYKLVEIPENKGYFSSIDIASDGNTFALGTEKGHVLLYNFTAKKVTRDIKVDGFKYGPYLSWSSNGKYLLLVEQFFTNWSINMDMPCRAAVLDISSGKIISEENQINHAELSSDSKSLIYLKNGEIIFRDIQSGETIKKFKPDNCAASFTLCKEGEIIAVAQNPTEEDLKNIPSIRTDKKAQKEALKYRQVTVYYDAKTFKRTHMSPDIFDIIFGMKYYEADGILYLHNAPNYRLNPSSTNSARNGYVQIVDPVSGEVSRTAFATSAPEPIYKQSPDGNYFAIASREARFSVIYTVQVYDRKTGDMISVFKNDIRLSEDTNIGRASFEFLPDNQTLVMGYGSKLALWKFLE